MIIKILWLFSLIAILNGIGIGFFLKGDETIETVSNSRYRLLFIFGLINIIGIGHLFVQCFIHFFKI